MKYRKRPLLAAASMAAGVALLMACQTAEEKRDEHASILRDAKQECGPNSGLDLDDGGSTLIVNHRGEDETLGVPFEDLACVISYLDVPGSVTGRMDSTRALDGMQEASWDGFTASWTYHPDNGLDVIITLD